MEFFITLSIIVFFILYADLRTRINRIEDAIEGKRGTGIEKTGTLQDVLSQEKPEEPTREAAEVPAKVIPPSKAPDLEIRWGAKTFTAIGGIALLFGVGFFLRYAFERNLITPTMRVVIGFAIGLLCIGLGEWLRKKYASYGQTLMGLGLGIFYLTLYAALHLYHVMSSPQAFIGMIMVTAVGIALAVRLNSEPLAAFALIGGLLTPMLVSSGENRPLVLFPYLALLNVTVLAFAVLKAWRGITLIGMFGTAIVFSFWYGRFFTEPQWFVAQAAITTFFAIFVVAGLTRYVIHKTKQDANDLAVTALNPFLYAVATYAIVPEVYREWVGTYFALLGVLYLGATLLIENRDERDRRYRNFLAVIGSAFLATAAPIAFDGNAITIAWAVLACALTYWSYIMDSKPLRAAGVVIGLFASFNVLSNAVIASGVTPWLNKRFLTGIFVILSQAAMVVTHRLKGAKEKDIESWIGIDAVKTYVLAGFIFASEVFTFYDHIWMIAAFSALALAGGWISLTIRNLLLRVMVYLTYALAVVILMFNHYSIALAAPLFLNLRIAVGLGLILSAWAFGLLLRRSPADAIKPEERELVRPALFIGIHLLGLWLLSSEIVTWFNLQLKSAAQQSLSPLRSAKNASLSIVWMVYAIALLVFGFARKYTLSRQFAIVLFGIVILKAFLYDTAELSNFYRFISFMTLGVLLLLSGYLYTRYKARNERKSSS